MSSIVIKTGTVNQAVKRYATETALLAAVPSNGSIAYAVDTGTHYFRQDGEWFAAGILPDIGPLAFLNYNGTSETILSQSNILSVVKQATGVYDIRLSVTAPLDHKSMVMVTSETGAPRSVACSQFDDSGWVYRVNAWTQADIAAAADLTFRFAVFEVPGGVVGP